MILSFLTVRILQGLIQVYLMGLEHPVYYKQETAGYRKERMLAEYEQCCHTSESCRGITASNFKLQCLFI